MFFFSLVAIMCSLLYYLSGGFVYLLVDVFVDHLNFFHSRVIRFFPIKFNQPITSISIMFFFSPYLFDLFKIIRMKEKLFPTISHIFLFDFFRFLESGLFSDFNKIRMKLSELASMQIHGLFKKSQALELSVMKEMSHPSDCFFPENRPAQQKQQHQQYPTIAAAFVAAARQQQGGQHTTMLPPPPAPPMPSAPSHMFYPHQHNNRFYQCQSNHFR